MPSSQFTYSASHRIGTGSVLALLLVGSLLAGCARMTASPDKTNYSKTNVPQDRDGLVTIDTSKPIPFDQHNFGSYCFDTYGCKVLYFNRYVTNQAKDVKQESFADLGDRFPDGLHAGHIAIPNYPHFPPPAQVDWRSSDGQAHHAEVDFEKIFKDKTVIHRVPQEQLPSVLHAPVNPDIVLVVDDRTIDVYMRAHVTTSVLQKPGNPYSDFRNDMIKVYTKTY